MIEITIPGYGDLSIEHLVLDYNGTIAFDGVLINGVKDLLHNLSECCALHVLTADTFGAVRSHLGDLDCTLHIVPREEEDRSKLAYVQGLSPENTVCIGNGRNDRLMLGEAALGIAVIQGEGAAAEALLAADIVSTSIIHALELLLHPSRLIATLRT